MSSDRQREWALRAVRLLIEDVDCGYGILTIVGGPSNKTWSNWISNVASSSLFSFEKQSSAILQPVKRHRAIVPCRMSTCFRRLMIARWISFSLSRRFSTVKAQRYNAMPLTFIFFFFFFSMNLTLRNVSYFTLFSLYRNFEYNWFFFIERRK